MMGTKNFFLKKSHFDLGDNRGFLYESVCRTMFWFVDSFWSLVCTYLFIVLGFITRYTFRYHGGENYKKIDSDCGLVHRQQDDLLGSNISEESGFGEKKNSEYDLGPESWAIKKCNESHEETESSVFMETLSTTNTSKYLFMSGNDMSGFMKEPKVMSFTIHEVCLDSYDDFYSKSTILDSTNKDFPRLNLEAEDVVHQEKTEDSAENINTGEVLERDEEETYRGLELVEIGEIAGLENDSMYKHDLSDEIPSENHLFSLKLEPLPTSLEDGMDIGSHQIDSTDDAILSDMSTGEGTEHMLIDTNEDMFELRNETPYLAEIQLSETRISEQEEVSEDEFIELEPHSGIFNDGFLSEQDVGKSEDKHESNESVHEEGGPMDSSKKSEEPILQEEELSVSDSDDEMRFEVLLNHQVDTNQLKHDSEESSVHDEKEPMEELSVSDSDDEMRFEVLLNHQDDINQQKHESKESSVHEEKENLEELSVSDSDDEMRFEVLLNHQDDTNQLKHETKESSVHEEKEPMENSTKSQEPSLEEEKSSVSDSDDEMGVEVLREHQDYIQHLKQELKHVKSRGLPTILEESEESPKMAEDLKPMNIDKKMEYKDRVEEIQKFYKSYAEKMRKLDILNDQTMHAIGLLKLKEPADQLNSTKKSSVPAFKSLLSQKFRQSKVGNHEDSPTQKFIKELQRDFELVYVGQVCLSWEILNWQHRKAQELQDYDPNGFRQYNCVAGEYQQYQVLLQRFIENEPFQERPRIQNYVEYRCVLRSFFQVPAIKDDCMKDKKPKQEGEYVIPIGMFTEIIGESMRLFWEFIRADKDDANGISRGLHGAHVDFEEPADLELLIDIQTNLQKKEKKLKEVLRSRTCIVKRFQKTQEDHLDRTLFYTQIEMKLVAKVLNMSRLTKDQLVWCHKKLEEINFVSRSLCIEPSFLLFPC